MAATPKVKPPNPGDIADAVASYPEGARQRIVDSLTDASVVTMLPPSRRRVKAWRKVYGKTAVVPPTLLILSHLDVLVLAGVSVGALGYVLDYLGLADVPGIAAGYKTGEGPFAAVVKVVRGT